MKEMKEIRIFDIPEDDDMPESVAAMVGFKNDGSVVDWKQIKKDKEMKGLPKDNSGCKVTKADAWLKDAEARERFYEGLKLHKEDLPYFIRRLIQEKVVDAEGLKIIIELENKEEQK